MTIEHRIETRPVFGPPDLKTWLDILAEDGWLLLQCVQTDYHAFWIFRRVTP